MKWKKLTIKELNKYIACHRRKQMKKSHMLVRKTHHSIALGSITFPRDSFQLNLTRFHMEANKDFVTVLNACWRSVVFITPPPI
jgi:hypothetical protein